METAIRMGTANSFALKSLTYRNSAIRALITERWREYLPGIGASINRTRNVNTGAQDSLSNEVRLTIEQVIYDGGRRDLGVDLARIDGLLAREDFRITYNELRLEIQRAYLQALAAQGVILLNQKSLERANLQLRQTRLEEDLGFATRVDVYSVAARVREVELRLREARNQHLQALSSLKQTLNLDYAAELELEGNLLRDYYLRPPVVDIEKLIATALGERPEVARSLATIRRLSKEKEIEEDAWLPRVTVNGYVARSGENFPVRERSWGAGFTITFPIGSTTSNTNSGLDITNDGSSRTGTTGTDLQFFDDLGYDRRLLESRLGLAEAVDQHNQLRNGLAIEIQRQYDTLREAWESIRIGNGRVYFNYASFHVLEQRYQVGEVRRQEIVEAEIELVRAQQDLVAAVTNYMIAAYTLEFSGALEIGELDLVRHQRGNGNIILSHLLDEDLDQIRNETPSEDIDTLRRDLTDPDRRPDPATDDEYLIDRIELE
ncbi:MAG: TolC family protein [Spirochaetales bacterium]|nr:TolC family protein [Spirochaetales bacterium]